MIETDSWSQIFQELRDRCSRHIAEAAPLVRDFIQSTEDRYASEIDAFVDLYRRDEGLSMILDPLLDQVREYLLWLRWVGWNISNLGPVLYQDNAVATDRLALGMLAYAAGRLIDDGFDNHETYKGHRKTLVGILRHQILDTPIHTACVQSAFIGFSLFHYALRRMRERSYEKCVDDVSRMFDVTSVGILAECMAGPKIDAHVYQQIIRRKSVAYNMILYKPFLAGIEAEMRLKLLRILSAMDELAQIINDYCDVQEDQKTGQVNALTHGIYDHTSIEAELLSRMQRLLEAASTLSTEIQDALAAIFENLGITHLLEIMPGR